MRSMDCFSVNAAEVHRCAVDGFLQACLLPDQGRKCAAAVVLCVVLRAAARSISIFAACRDLSDAPSDRAVLGALENGLPGEPPVLEDRLNAVLAGPLPRRMRRGVWQVAIDFHLVPYYGEPHAHANEVYYGKPRQGTNKFHAYATACVIDHGLRYTLAVTWVKRGEAKPDVLRRLVDRVRGLDLKIKRVLLDREFFTVAVVEFLKGERLPFVMPVMFRGRTPKKGSKAKGLRAIKQRPAGRYEHAMANKQREATVTVVVGYRTYRRRKKNRRGTQKLLFATWRVGGSPTEVRELYRKRFGIETSYRQARQARVYTCARCPRLRLFFFVVALALRNLWVWLHHTKLSEGPFDNRTLHLERLRFKRMLDWVAEHVRVLMHDGTTAYTLC